MSLQIRRGTDAQRTGVIFDSGEIIFTTDTQKLYVGDGITAGGKNVLATSAGGGVTFNNTTQRFDFTTSGLGLTTSDVTEGTNFYYTRQRAQDDAAGLFTATGAPNSTGNITATTAPNTVSISGSTAGMVVGERFIVAGTGGSGLTGSPTTYYVAQIVSGSTVKLASNRLNALAGTPLVTVTTNVSYTGTTYAAGGESSNVVFTYDSVNHTMVANVTLDGIGITSVQADTAPNLGGNLSLNSKTINGTGTINISGTITGSSLATSALTISTNAITSNNGVINIGNSATASNVNIYSPTSTAVNVYGVPGTAFEILSANGPLASPTTLINNDGAGGIKFSGRNSNNIYNTVASIYGVYKGPPSSLADPNLKAQGIMYFGVGNGSATPTQASFDQNGVFTVPVLTTTVYSVAGTALPNASGAGVGARAFVSDAVSPTFTTAYTGGGTNKVPVYSDGTAWRVG